MAYVNTPPELRLADMGSYTIGGRDIAVSGKVVREITLSGGMRGFAYDPNGHFRIEQGYVQYFVPQERRSEVPVVLIHGGGLTGTTWETTPDGRPGWLNHLVAGGFEVHVVDMVERGRAGFSALADTWPDTPLARSAEEAWSLFRIGAPDGYAGREGFSGQAFPVDAFDMFVAMMVPRWTSTMPAQIAALDALLDRLGPCALVGHSQGGGFAFDLGARRADLVRTVVALEPHGAFEIPEDHSLSGRDLIVIEGDYMGEVPAWHALQSRFDVALDNWARAGGHSERFVLADAGLSGHSHMMMMDRGSERIVNWVMKKLLDGKTT